MSRIVILQGHPDASQPHLCHGLADAYAEGATSAGHDVERIDIATLEFPLIRSEKDFTEREPPDCITDAQQKILQAEHIVLVYPLWMGMMPALVKGFFEQVFRYGFAFETSDKGIFNKNLAGRSARLVVTMGMPAFFYRWYFGAHGLKSLERSILKFSGISPVRETLFGRVESADDEKLLGWLAKMRQLGEAAA